MEMTLRERMTAVYEGKTPDRVPFILDLSHYFYERFKKPWSLLGGYAEPEYDLIDYGRKFGAGFYVPNQMPLFEIHYDDGVSSGAWTDTVDGVTSTHWRFETPKGSIERTRVWSEQTYAWATTRYGVKTEDDIRILADALCARRFKPLPEHFCAWDEYVGDSGLVQIVVGYSAMGQFMHYWMGLENTLYACYDWEDTMREAVDRINANTLEALKMLLSFPGLVVLMGDNFSSDCQPPEFFKKWSAPYYRQAAELIHEAGKKLSVHVDGRLKGAIGMMRDVGVDIIDAVTPKPMGDLTARECRDEAGDKLVLSGGVSPDLWLPNVPLERFEQAVMDWLELRKTSPALVASAGDQVPPQAEERRIEAMRRMVEEHGRY